MPYCRSSVRLSRLLVAGAADLLNELRGFECRCLGGERLKPHDHSVAKPEDIGLVGLDSNVAATPNGRELRLDDDRMTEVDELVRLPVQFRKQLLGLAPELLYLVPASIRLRVRQVGALVQLEIGSQPRPQIRRYLVRVDELSTSLPDRVDDLVHASHELDVLHRHGPGVS